MEIKKGTIGLLSTPGESLNYSYPVEIDKISPLSKSKKHSLGVIQFLKRVKNKEEYQMFRYKGQQSFTTDYPLSFLKTDEETINKYLLRDKINGILRPKTTKNLLARFGINSIITKTGFCSISSPSKLTKIQAKVLVDGLKLTLKIK